MVAELPELEILRRQMNDELAGHTVVAVEALQEKCLNVTIDEFCQNIKGKRINCVSRKGKWLVIDLQPDFTMLLCPGMGFDLWHYGIGSTHPEKYQLRLEFDDGSGLTCRFWWFGYIRLLRTDQLESHPEISKLGPDPMRLDADDFRVLAKKFPRSSVKSLILDQEKLSGIGNAYSHDILWTARLHPNRKLGTLTEDEIERYREAIIKIIDRAIELGGIEDDFYRTGGNHANWEAFSIIGYKENKPCPRCGQAIEKIKSGTTSSFICPACQPLASQGNY